MSEHFDVVVSRLRNMLARITAKDPDFDDLCAKHAELTTQIRRLNPSEDAGDAQRDEQLRRSRAQLEQELFHIMSSNTRI